MKIVKQYLLSLGDRQLMPSAIKVALVIGTLLFTINHGWALLNRRMTRDRWASAGITYLIPYLVNIHGQFIMKRKLTKSAKDQRDELIEREPAQPND